MRGGPTTRRKVLVTPEPNLLPVRRWVLDKLSRQPMRWRRLQKDMLDEPWLAKHLNSVIRELRRKCLIHPDDYSGAFSLKANPLLSLVERGGE